MAKVTIIVPAFNAENSIERCANSVLYQTLEDIEIIDRDSDLYKTIELGFIKFDISLLNLGD